MYTDQSQWEGYENHDDTSDVYNQWSDCHDYSDDSSYSQWASGDYSNADWHVNADDGSYSSGAGYKRQWHTTNPNESSTTSKLLKLDPSSSSSTSNSQSGQMQSYEFSADQGFSNQYNPNSSTKKSEMMFEKNHWINSLRKVSSAISNNLSLLQGHQRPMMPPPAPPFLKKTGFQSDPQSVKDAFSNDFPERSFSNQSYFGNVQSTSGFPETQAMTPFSRRGKRESFVRGNFRNSSPMMKDDTWEPDGNLNIEFDDDHFDRSSRRLATARQLFGRRFSGSCTREKSIVDLEKLRDALMMVQGCSDFDLSALISGFSGYSNPETVSLGQLRNQFRGKFGQRGSRGSFRGILQNNMSRRDFLDFKSSSFGQSRGNRSRMAIDRKAGRGTPARSIGRGAIRGKVGKNTFNAKGMPIHGFGSITDPSKLSTAEKINLFCLWIKNEMPKCNAIQTIENALTSCKLGLRSTYDVEELIKIGGRSMYTGCLFIQSIFLARAVAASKKELKHDVYKKAIDILSTKTGPEVMKLSDPGIETLREELGNSIAANKGESWEKLMDMCKEEAVSKLETATKLAGSDVQTGFSQIIAQLKTVSSQPDNEISALEQAFSASHCTLNHEYIPEDSRLPTGKAVFHGTLKIADIIVGRGVGRKKKDAKHEAYKRAVSFLKENPISVIVKGNVDEPQQLSGFGTVQQDDKTSKVAIECVKPTNLSSKLQGILQLVKDSPYRANTVNAIDTMAVQCFLAPTCLYRKADSDNQKRAIVCELYLDDILIASGEAEFRKDAQVEAYTKAWEELSTVSVKKLVTQNKRLMTAEKYDPLVIDVVVKGFGKYGESNLPRLRRLKIDILDNTKPLNSLVIVEHDDWKYDRLRHAFCILNNSATMSSMLMEWEIEPLETSFKCKMLIQKMLLSEATASSKNNARNNAAAIALMKFYQTQDVIRINRRDDSARWILVEELKEGAKKMEAEQGDMEHSKGESEGKEESDMVNKWIVKYAEYLVKEFLDKETLDELVFAPGLPSKEKKEITNIAFNVKLKVDVRQREGQHYFAISRKLSPQEIAEYLKTHKTGHGKYVLVPKEDLPGTTTICGSGDNHVTMHNLLKSS